MAAVAAALRNLPPLQRPLLPALPSMQRLAAAARPFLPARSHLAMETAVSSRPAAKAAIFSRPASQTRTAKAAPQAGAAAFFFKMTV